MNGCINAEQIIGTDMRRSMLKMTNTRIKIETVLLLAGLLCGTIVVTFSMLHDIVLYAAYGGILFGVAVGVILGGWLER